jgi:hypothetical protein
MAVVHGPGEGEHHAVGASSLTLKATAPDVSSGAIAAKYDFEPV